MRLRWLVLLLMLLGVVVATWFRLAPDRSASSQAVAVSPGAPAVPVTEGRAETRDVPIWLSGIGSVQPLNAVTVKVRVDGQLDSVAFTEGQDVHAGDVLAQIDPRSFRAQLKQAQAKKAKDEAQLANARLDLARSRGWRQGCGPRAEPGYAAGQVARLRHAGRPGGGRDGAAATRILHDHGAARRPGRAAAGRSGQHRPCLGRNGLVTITQMQPIAVLFAVPQDDLPDILAAMAKGDVTVVAYSRDGERLLATGKLVFVDSQVDPATGQIKLKALFDNADRRFVAGEFVNARVQVATISHATVVPGQAIERGQNGTYVYRVKPDDTVEVGR